MRGRRLVKEMVQVRLLLFFFNLYIIKGYVISPALVRRVISKMEAALAGRGEWMSVLATGPSGSVARPFAVVQSGVVKVMVLVRIES